MPCRAGPAAVLLVFIALCGPDAASAQQAAASQKDCSGTLCDLYYGNSGDTTAAPGKSDTATPLTVPGGGLLHRMFGGDTPQAAQASGQPAPEKKPLVGVGGGGIAAMARGEPAQRCTGTLCDFYYGGPPQETPAQQPRAAPGTQRATTEDVSDTPQPRAAPEAEIPVYRAPPRCAATGRDPWACYR